MGIAAQKKLDSLGLRAIPIMSVEEMREAMPGMGEGECPKEDLHETDGEGYVAWDDVSGQELCPNLTRAARREQMRISTAWESTRR